MNIFKNTRYYKWVSVDGKDELKEVRVVRVQNENICTIVTTKGKNIGERVKIKIGTLTEEYQKLSPDGYISFNIASIGKGLRDVAAIITRTKDINQGAQLPFGICRQCVSDLFAKQLTPDHVDYVGISISQETCPADVKFENYLACDGIEVNETVAYYIGDKLPDILKILKYTKEYDQALVDLFDSHCMYLANNNKFIAESYKIKSDVDGYCKSLNQLLEMNNFEYDLLRAFDIIPTDLDKENFSEGTLSPVAAEVLSGLLTMTIDKSIVLKYDKDIDLSKIKRRYCLVSDKDSNVYVVGYTVCGKYHVPIENTESEQNVEKLNTLLASPSTQLAYSHLKFRQDKYK